MRKTLENSHELPANAFSAFRKKDKMEAPAFIYLSDSDVVGMVSGNMPVLRNVLPLQKSSGI